MALAHNLQISGGIGNVRVLVGSGVREGRSPPGAHSARRGPHNGRQECRQRPLFVRSFLIIIFFPFSRLASIN